MLIGSVALAVAFWGVMFGLKWGVFWLDMTLAASILALMGIHAQRGNLARIFRFTTFHVVVGLASAAVLYGLFYLGDTIAALLFDFASEQVGGIYAMKSQMSPLVIAVLLSGVIGPAEEVYWRGFVQDRLAGRYGDMAGWLYAGLIYGAVHIWAWNFMLIMAALLCGMFWGWVYMRWKSLWPGIISHSVWDLTIFILLPVR